MLFWEKMFTILTLLSLPCPALFAQSHTTHHHSAAVEEAEFAVMPEPGRKVPIGNNRYLVYRFDRKLKIGYVIMKVQAFDSRGEKDTSLTIIADSWMPSMPSMEGGRDTFKVSKKGDYLVPINISMAGDWEIKVTVLQDGKIVYRGSHKFDV